MHTAISDQIRARVLAALKAEGIGARRFEEKHKLKKWSLRGFLDPERNQSPSVDRAKEICDALGLEFYIGPPRPSGVVFDHEGASDEFARIPLHEVELAAGVGVQNDDEATAADLLFRRDWLRRMGLSPEKASLARVRGDSMQPMLFDRDVVLLDTSRTDVPVGRKRASGAHSRYLVALERDGEARVKWAERPNDDTLVIFSENSVGYGPEFYLRSEIAETRIIGHVVWWCHTVRS